MPKTPKDKPEAEQIKCGEPVTDDLWETDIRERRYYYDDAHGYETYEPEDDNDPVD